MFCCIQTKQSEKIILFPISDEDHTLNINLKGKFNFVDCLCHAITHIWYAVCMLNAEIYLCVCVCVWMLYRCIWPLYVRICNVQYSEVHISVATMKAMTVDQIVFSTGAFYVIVFFFVCVWCFMVWINGANNPWLSIKLHFSYRNIRIV